MSESGGFGVFLGAFCVACGLMFSGLFFCLFGCLFVLLLFPNNLIPKEN